jgi:outer membrane protein OmpA-like peptidoglycan-associated protein
MKYWILLLSLITVPLTSVAQDTLRTRYGVVGGLSINKHTTDFRALPGVPNCCPLFSSGSGTGPLFGGLFEIPIAPTSLFDIGLNYIDQSATLSESEPVAEAVGGVVTEGSFNHTIDATIHSLNLDLALRHDFLKYLMADVGLRFGLPITKNYSQEEVIAGNTGTFVDSLGNDTHSRTRNVNSGVIPNATSLLLSVIAGVSYELPLNADRTLFLVPGISCGVALTNVVSGLTWKPNTIDPQVGLMYSPLPIKKIIYDTIVTRDTVTKLVARNIPSSFRQTHSDHSTKKIEGDIITERTTITESYENDIQKPKDLICSVSPVELKNGEERPIAVLQIEEFLKVNTHPLLGYVFFGEDSSTLPARYKQISEAQARAFDQKTLFDEDGIGINHQLLNIIGWNLGRYPNATITVTGCNANSRNEKNNLALSKARAQTVKDYLTNVWKIAPDRITLDARNLPATPSSIRTELGAEENRRIEITSSDYRITGLFIAYDTIRTATPPALRFKLQASSSDNITGWKLTLRQGADTLKKLSGNGTPTNFDWNLAGDRHAMPRFDAPLDADLITTNAVGDTASSTSRLPLKLITIQMKRREHIGDTETDQFNLVLFNFGSSKMTAEHERIIALVKQQIKPTSDITIEGFTDIIGNPKGNRALATSRAKSTAAALGRSDAKVFGIGQDRLLYPNDTPEGRFYCRTVQITAKTPVN